MRQTPTGGMLARYFLSAVSEPNVATIAQKRAGLVMFKPTNAIGRERFVGIFAPIGGRRRELVCNVPTWM